MACTTTAGRDFVVRQCASCPQYFLADGDQQVCPKCAANSSVQVFPTGATRDADRDKLDYEGFLSPDVLRRYAEYMHRHRVQADGTLRDSDNWQKGIPREQYMKSLLRHVIEVWSYHRGCSVKPRSPRDPQDIEEALCGVIFNASGYLFELLREEQA